MSHPSHTDDAAQSTELKRVMGPGLLLLFIVGDILGTGVYALTGQVAAEVGGAAWAPFMVAFAVALVALPNRGCKRLSARRSLGRRRGLPRMEVLTPPIWKTSTCLTLLPMRASPALI